MNIRMLKVGAIISLLMWLTGCSMGPMMIHENKSPYSFDKTVATITDNAKAQGWQIPKIYDFQKSMLTNGQPDPSRIKVIKLCHPEIASKMLTPDESKYVGAMMPCSIAVYEYSDGTTYVSSMNMGLMGTMFGGEIGGILDRVAEEDAIILRFLHE